MYQLSEKNMELLKQVAKSLNGLAGGFIAADMPAHGTEAISLQIDLELLVKELEAEQSAMLQNLSEQTRP